MTHYIEIPCEDCGATLRHRPWAVLKAPKRCSRCAENLRRKLHGGNRPAQPEANIKSAIADEAKRIVDGARRGAYGTPEDNFTRVARFWTAYFANTGRDLVVRAEDVSPMMRLMKEARLCETPDHYDSHVDLVGYALTGAEVNGVKKPVDNP